MPELGGGMDWKTGMMSGRCGFRQTIFSHHQNMPGGATSLSKYDCFLFHQLQPCHERHRDAYLKYPAVRIKALQCSTCLTD